MKKIHLLNIILVLLIAAATARVAADIIAYRIAGAFPKSAKRNEAPQGQSPLEDLSTFAPILEKGLFGKATQGKLTPVVKAPQAQAGPSISQADLTLLGTVRGSFRETFALIRKSAGQEERVFRLGDKVFDLGPLVSVQKESVEILAGGKKVRLLTPQAIATESSKPATPPAASAQPAGLATQVAAGSFVIDQRALNAALDNIGQAMTDARLLPSVKDGKVEGFKVSEVKPAGVFGMVGIRNGDTLLRINDFPIDSPEKAIQSLASLKGQSRIKLDMVRDGQPTTFNYDIR